MMLSLFIFSSIFSMTSFALLSDILIQLVEIVVLEFPFPQEFEVVDDYFLYPPYLESVDSVFEFLFFEDCCKGFSSKNIVKAEWYRVVCCC